MIKLVLPSLEYEKEIERFKRENCDDHSLVNGTGGLEEMLVQEWIEKREDYRHGRNLPDGYVPGTQFIAVRESDGKIVGMVNLRHELNEYLLMHGGHIGYMTAVDERGKGYCKEMLRLCLIECKKMGIDHVLLTCDKWNVASAKVIIANGGVLENEVDYEGENPKYKGTLMQRYWIKTA